MTLAELIEACREYDPRDVILHILERDCYEVKVAIVEPEPSYQGRRVFCDLEKGQVAEL